MKTQRPARVLRLAVAGAAAVMFGACMMTAGGSSSTETGDKVALNGKVLGGNGMGIPGVIVVLANTTLVDTTDVNGAYVLEGPPTAMPSQDRPDTLRFTFQGNVIAKTEVRGIDPTATFLMLMQRGFSGTFTGADNGVGRIEAVVRGHGIPPDDSVTAIFFHNTLAGNYSGFVWFPLPVGEMREYSIHINIYNGENTRTGRSIEVPFNESAGNIVIPPFNAENLLPAPTPTSKVAGDAGLHGEIVISD